MDPHFFFFNFYHSSITYILHLPFVTEYFPPLFLIAFFFHLYFQKRSDYGTTLGFSQDGSFTHFILIDLKMYVKVLINPPHEHMGDDTKWHFLS